MNSKINIKKLPLEEISSFVEKTAENEESKLQKDSEFISKTKQVQQLILNFSRPQTKTFTLTSSELNAYLG
jgi:hypothetical protein